MKTKIKQKAKNKKQKRRRKTSYFSEILNADHSG